MKIPNKLQKFDHLTLVIVGDFDKASLYLADDDKIEEIKKLKAPIKKVLTKTGLVKGGGERFYGPSSDVDEGGGRLELAKNICSEIKSLGSKIKFINLVIPAEMARRIKNEMPKATQTKITKVIEKDLSKKKLVDVIQRLEKLT
ncbi:MAG: hypothetical protein WCW31_05780 [Patescibacteria group bacterium]|jgi:protein required for attachment to host cells